MANEMIERVAKAIFDDDFPTGALSWEICIKTGYFKIAKAAIAAMRKPTEEMEQACYEYDASCDPGVYSYMIDAALKE